MKKLLIALLALACSSMAVFAQSTNTNVLERLIEFQRQESSLKFQKGEITLRDGLAKLNLPDDFRYLSPDDANTVLVKMWGNPPGQKTLGMIVPADQSFMDREAWAVVIQYDEEGYVKDSDADKINYDKLLKEMQDATREASKERVKEGYPSIELVGWATPPRYDKESHKLYWAKEIKFADAKDNTLNYNIRALGRRGVLVLNVIASMNSFPQIEKRAPDIVKMVEFNEGHRYADFDGKSDKVAAYGLAALVAGGIAAKAGLFKLLWVGILAAKKFIILGAAALVSFFKKLFKGKKSSAPPSDNPPSDNAPLT